MNQIVRPVAHPYPRDVERSDLQKAIEHVSSMRERILRIAYFGSVLSQPPPSGAHRAQDRDRYLGILRRDVTMIRAVCDTLSKGTDLPKTNSAISAWVHSVAITEPEKLAAVTNAAPLAEAVLAAMEESTEAGSRALAAYVAAGEHGYSRTISSLCETMWNVINAEQDAALDQANTAATALSTRLTRLERIGKHVRLVSLNASVEAARAGDVGKGLMVIAQEFKVLAEEIQTLAKEAHADMEIML